jgi:hypothetical protein
MTVQRFLLLAFVNETVVGLGGLVVRAGEDVKVAYEKLAFAPTTRA